jgi:hypothetical protein
MQKPGIVDKEELTFYNTKIPYAGALGSIGMEHL